MSLIPYYNKTVKIISNDGMEYIGKVNDYIYPEDNESGKESIIIDTSNGENIEFGKDDIKTIIAI